MGQLGFFYLSRRYEGLDVKDDPLVAIVAMIPWESLRPKLKASLITGGLRASDVARKSPAASYHAQVPTVRQRHSALMPGQQS
jgi:IS5 family transposase